MSNPGSNGTKTISIDVGTGPVDTGKIAIVIIESDQVVVNAAVDPSIAFSLTANSTNFGTLAPGVVDTADTNITLQVGTNAANGYTISVKDAGNNSNPGLYSSSSSTLIGSADGSYNATADLSTAGSGYGIQASCTAGCTTGSHISSNYRQGTDVVGGLTLTASVLATFPSTLSADHTIQVVHKAKAASTTPAGSYSDTITYVATGNF